jgi:L-ascorbate metabolism protein UlaG (beta-lactamase superfamily)
LPFLFGVFLLSGCYQRLPESVAQEIGDQSKLNGDQEPLYELAADLTGDSVANQVKPIPTARLIWDEELGARTLIFDTIEGDISVSNIGHGSAMLKFEETIVHVNPWYGVGDYSLLPTADQVWITDADPEHLDIRAIRSVSDESTLLIVDPFAGAQLEGLLDYQVFDSGENVELPPIDLQVITSSISEVNSKGIVEKFANAYLAKFGEFRLLIGGGLQIEQIYGFVDVALLPIGGANPLNPGLAAEAAKQINPAVLLPYQVGEQDPAEVAALLEGSGIQVWTINPAQSTELGHHRASPSAAGSTQIETPDLDHLRIEDLSRIIHAWQAANALLLPDLQQIPAFDLHLQFIQRQDPITRLRLSSSVQNLGAGPLELEGVIDREAGISTVTQRINTESGVVRNRPVGEFILHPEHHHWHLDGFTFYEIWSLTPSGTLDQIVVSSGKVSFCIRDFGRSPQATEFQYARYTQCGAALQGLSVGWFDTYKYYLAGQSIDITSLEDGNYALVSTADPFNFIQESDETNNIAAVYFSLQANRLQILDKPAETVAQNQDLPN